MSVYRSRRESARRGAARWVWVVVGTGGFIACGTVSALLLGSFMRAGGISSFVVCQSNLKQLALAGNMYAQDYDDRLPLRQNWGDGTLPYTKTRSLYICPKIAEEHRSPFAALTDTREYPAPVTGPPSYAYNSRLSGLRSGRIANKSAVPMFYDSSALRWNASDPVSSFARRHRRSQGDGGVAAYADGHVKWVRQLPNSDAR